MQQGSKEHQAACATRDERKSKSVVRRWSHVATRVRDLEATRHFYEDLLGLPLVLAFHADSEPDDPTVKTNYMHAFFELGDGSCIAFFQFPEGLRGQQHPHSPDAYERHLAMQVDKPQDVEAIKARLEASGLAPKVVDHGGAFYSLYCNDPDGDTVEVTYHSPLVDELYCQPDARKQLAEWLAKFAPA